MMLCVCYISCYVSMSRKAWTLDVEKPLPLLPSLETIEETSHRLIQTSYTLGHWGIHTYTHTCTHQCRLLQYSRLQTHTHRGFPCETTLTQLSKFLPLACRLTHKQQLVTCCCQELWSCSSCGVSANFFFLPKYRDLHPSKACSKCVVSQVWVSGKLLQSQWKSLRICIILSL